MTSKFDLVPLFFYTGNNPLIRQLRLKYYKLLQEKCRFINFIINQDFFDILNDKTLKIIILPFGVENLQSFERKYKTKAVLICDPKLNNKILFVTKQDFKTIKIESEDEEYLLQNFRFAGKNFNLDLKIGPKSGYYLKDQFNLNRVPEKVTIKRLIGETTNKYHFQSTAVKDGKEIPIYFFTYKEDCENPYEKEYANVPFNVEKINKLSLKFKILPHQIEGGKFLKFWKKSFLLFDTGLGKSATAIATAIDLELKKVLVICPASLKTNWSREIKNFQQSYKIISGTKWDSTQATFTIINFDILKNFYTLPKKGRPSNEEIPKLPLDLEQFDCIIIDEAQKLRNQKSQRSKVVSKLSQKVEYIFALSGTLIEKNEHFYNVCKVLNIPVEDIIITNGGFVTQYESYLSYMKTYCNRMEITLKDNRKVLVTAKTKNNPFENTNTIELRQRIKHIFLRKLKTKELQGFVSKNRIPIFFDLSLREQKQYAKYFEDFLQEKALKGIVYSEEAEKLISMIKLRQFLASLKVDYTASFVLDKVEDDSKCIVFTHFIEEFEKFKAIFGKDALYLESGFPEKNAKTVDQFESSDKQKILVANIALGVGYNITSAKYVVINSPDWNSDTHIQAEDRAWRLGQTEDVFVFYPIFENTEEEYVFNRSNSKLDNSNTLYEE